MQRGGYVYIMASPNKGVLYVGVTADLYKRVYDHRHKFHPDSFTAKYNCVTLVYYSGFDRIEEAIAEEKRIKAGKRKQKEELIETMNKDWNDLWDNVQHW